jgi:anaerobic ribonucleoside-triphosphate reductase activating protein
MYYGEIKNCDIANGTGVRVTLFVSGCRNHCKGCFQPETWDFEYGKPYTDETKQSILDMLKPDYIDGLTLLGGDPFEPENQSALLPLLREFHKIYPDKNIWAYTGYIFEDLLSGAGHPCCEYTNEMLSNIDVLVDGPYIDDLRNISLQFRGSSNQRIIDVKSSLKTGEAVIIPDKKRGSFYD